MGIIFSRYDKLGQKAIENNNYIDSIDDSDMKDADELFQEEYPEYVKTGNFNNTLDEVYKSISDLDSKITVIVSTSDLIKNSSFWGMGGIWDAIGRQTRIRDPKDQKKHLHLRVILE